jgi:hypothetical protein
MSWWEIHVMPRLVRAEENLAQLLVRCLPDSALFWAVIRASSEAARPGQMPLHVSVEQMLDTIADRTPRFRKPAEPDEPLPHGTP